MQGRKSLGHNNFLIDTSMQAYISIYLPLLCIVRGFLWSLSLVNTKKRAVLSLLKCIWVWILDITEVQPLCHPHDWTCWKTQSQDFVGVLCSFGNYITMPGSLPSPFLSMQVFVYSPSPFSVFLSFDAYFLLPVSFKNPLLFFICSAQLRFYYYLS